MKCQCRIQKCQYQREEEKKRGKKRSKIYPPSHVNKNRAEKLPSLPTKVHSCRDCKIYSIALRHHHRNSNLLHGIKAKYLQGSRCARRQGMGEG